MGQRKELQYNFFIIQLTFSDGTLVASFWIMLMKGSYTALFIGYIKIHPILRGLQNCPSQGNKNFLKWLQLLVPLDQYLQLKMTIGIKCSSNLF